MSTVDAPAETISGETNTTHPLASALVCTRNRGALILSTVKTILANDYPNFEFVLIDQSTDDESAKAIEPFLDDPRLRYIRTPTKGLGLARDIGLRAAKGEFVLITDDDCDVPENWISGQVEVFLNHPQVAVVHCDVLPGPCDYSKGYITATAITEKNQLITGLGLHERQGVGIGAAISVRRSIALKLGGFDPGLGAGTPTFAGEDTDVSFKALLNGYHVFRLHDVPVIHHGFRTYDEARTLYRGYMLGAGAMYGKLIKCGYWRLLLFLPLIYWDNVVPRAIEDLRKGQVPRVLGRIVYLTKGIVWALRTPIDRERDVFQV